MNLYAVILAGGNGSKFWPVAPDGQAKHLLNLMGGGSLLARTLRRLDGFIPKENIFIITTKYQKDSILANLKSFPEKNLIIEPFGKNTAACVGYSAINLRKKDKDAVIITLPADHHIGNIKAFQNDLRKGVEFVKTHNCLVTIGLKPQYPEVDYGYIQTSESVEDGVFKVISFAEKPNFNTAQRFVKSGDFLWNSGIYVWRASTILTEIKHHLPDLHAGLEKLVSKWSSENFGSELIRVYGEIEKISIDHGVMENSDKVFCIQGSFEWNDVSDWDSVFQIKKKDRDGNSYTGNVYLNKTTNSLIRSKNKFLSVIGLNNVIVIESDDGILVCDRTNAQDVKQLMDHLKLKKGGV